MIVLLACVLLLVGVFWVTKKKDTTSNSSGTTGQPSQHIEGKGQKGVKLVEYADYECPYCGSYYPIVKAVEQKYDNEITYQFVNFPLAGHQNARAAHRAAEAASLQGKFWEMHDLLYTKQNDWKDSTNPASVFEGYAQQLGLNMDKYRQDANGEQVNATINADVQQGQNLNISGTPTFFLDGKNIGLPQSVDEFSKLIDQEISSKK